jgi:hypothetical protein
MLLLIVCASDCAAQGDAMGYTFAGLCGVIVVFLAVGATWVSVEWEAEIQKSNRTEVPCESFLG